MSGSGVGSDTFGMFCEPFSLPGGSGNNSRLATATGEGTAA